MMRRSGIGDAAAIFAFSLFCVTLVLSLILGMGLYRSVQERAEASEARRLGPVYLTAKLRGADAADSVRVGRFGDGDALFLTEWYGETKFETVLYAHDGWMMELLCRDSAEMEPEAGEQIALCRSFEARSEKGLVTVSFTDQTGETETVHVYLRSGD